MRLLNVDFLFVEEEFFLLLFVVLAGEIDILLHIQLLLFKPHRVELLIIDELLREFDIEDIKLLPETARIQHVRIRLYLLQCLLEDGAFLDLAI